MCHFVTRTLFDQRWIQQGSFLRIHLSWNWETRHLFLYLNWGLNKVAFPLIGKWILTDRTDSPERPFRCLDINCRWYVLILSFPLFNTCGRELATRVVIPSVHQLVCVFFVWFIFVTLLLFCWIPVEGSWQQGQPSCPQTRPLLDSSNAGPEIICGA